MTNRGLSRGHRQLVGVLPEEPFDRAELDLVAERSRSAVSVYIINLVWREARASQRIAHRAEGSFAVLRRSSEVKSVGGHAITDHLRIDLGAALPGVLIFLKNENSCTLAHDESVAFLVPRAGGPGWGVVERG